MRIIELFIDDLIEGAGIDAVSLVNQPAIEENWIAFNNEINPEIEAIIKLLEDDIHSDNCENGLCNIISPEDAEAMIEYLKQYGEDASKLEEEGWQIVSIKELGKEKFFDVSSKPNEESQLDNAFRRIRYKYVGPRGKSPKGYMPRDFCRQMLRANRVYRYEDILRMQDEAEAADPNFIPRPSGYSVDFLSYNGGINCRHRFVELIYKPANDGDIINNSASKKLLEGETQLIQPTNKRVNFGKEEFESYNDYPEVVKRKACKARKYKEENPNIDCGTRIGWTRSAQLCSGENISEETISRMASFARHLPEAEKQDSYEDGCALLMLDAWGGKEGIEWAQRKLKEIRNEEFEEKLDGENPCWEGYEPIGTKIKDGKRVPNCVKKSKNKSQFSIDEEKKMIIGPAMIPDKMIPRRAYDGSVYNVFFSKETIKKLAEKFMKDKLTDSSNIEHNGKKLNGVFFVESWLIEDSEMDKSAKYGFKLPEGTWMLSAKVENDEVWNQVKNGKLLGYSVEGYFAEKAIFSENEDIINQIKKILTEN